MPSPKHRRVSSETRQRARELRKSLTPAEQKLWRYLRNRNLGGYKFRRQQPIGPFIADFYCAEVRLVVEVDGGVHLERADYDEARTMWLEEHGYHVIRFGNDEALTRLDEVAQEILSCCDRLKEGKRDD